MPKELQEKEVKTVQKKGGGPLNRYRLMAGGHVGADFTHEFSEEEIEIAKTQGRALRYPSKQYKVGDVVESDKDLVHMFGATKFQLLGPAKKGKKGAADDSDVDDIDAAEEGNAGQGQLTDPTPQNLDAGFTHPHGQVNTGFQQTGGTDTFGNPISGPISKAELEEKGLVNELPDKSHKSEKPVQAKKGAKPAVGPHAARPTHAAHSSDASSGKSSKAADGKPGASHKKD